MTKTLLLNNNFQVLAFITERRAIKLLLKNKAEVLSIWSGRKISSGSGYIDHPATIRMKYHINLNRTKLIFSRQLVFRRDKFICAYCSKLCKKSNITIDHVLPKSMGGENSFLNCVAACIACNLRKANQTPEQAGMILKITPYIPNKFLFFLPDQLEWHDDWLFFTGEF